MRLRRMQLLLLFVLPLVFAVCKDPTCSGHGSCPDGFFCLCDDGYIGLQCGLPPIAIHRPHARIPGMIEQNKYAYYRIEAPALGGVITVDPEPLTDFVRVYAAIGHVVSVPSDSNAEIKRQFYDEATEGQAGAKRLVIDTLEAHLDEDNDETGYMYVTVGGAGKKGQFVRYWLYYDDLMAADDEVIAGLSPLMGWVVLSVAALCSLLCLIACIVGGIFGAKWYKKRRRINAKTVVTDYKMDEIYGGKKGASRSHSRARGLEAGNQQTATDRMSGSSFGGTSAYNAAAAYGGGSQYAAGSQYGGAAPQYGGGSYAPAGSQYGGGSAAYGVASAGSNSGGSMYGAAAYGNAYSQTQGTQAEFNRYPNQNMPQASAYGNSYGASPQW